MSLRMLRYLAEYTVFRALVCVVGILSARQCARLAEGLAGVVQRLLPRKLTRWDVARENLRTAFGDRYTDAQIDELIRRMWVHLFRMITEIVQLPRKLRLENCADVLIFRHRDELVRTLCTGRPVLILSGHFGNWEIATAALGVFGFRAGIVARDLDNSYLHDWFARYRQATGHRLISKKGGGGEIVEILERAGIVGMLGDQDAGSKGMFVPFFGKDASTFKSIALLALQYRAYLCVTYGRRLEDDFENQRWVRYEVGCEEIIDPLDFDGPDALDELTRRYTAALERIVRRAPEQYFWVHRRWKSKPRRRTKRRKAA